MTASINNPVKTLLNEKVRAEGLDSEKIIVLSTSNDPFLLLAIVGTSNKERQELNNYGGINFTIYSKNTKNSIINKKINEIVNDLLIPELTKKFEAIGDTLDKFENLTSIYVNTFYADSILSFCQTGEFLDE